VKLGDNREREGIEGWDNSCFRSAKEKKSTAPSRSAAMADVGVSRTVKAKAARREFLTLVLSAGPERTHSYLVYILFIYILLTNGGFLY